MEMMTIPTKEAILALDMVAAHLMNNEDDGVTMSNSGEYVKLKNLFQFHNIAGPFSKMVLNAAKDEGKRQMFQSQPLHLRTMASKDADDFLAFEDQYQEPVVQD
jgi:hypothetical protein